MSGQDDKKKKVMRNMICITDSLLPQPQARFGLIPEFTTRSCLHATTTLLKCLKTGRRFLYYKPDSVPTETLETVIPYVSPLPLGEEALSTTHSEETEISSTLNCQIVVKDYSPLPIRSSDGPSVLV